MSKGRHSAGASRGRGSANMMNTRIVDPLQSALHAQNLLRSVSDATAANSGPVVRISVEDYWADRIATALERAQERPR